MALICAAAFGAAAWFLRTPQKTEFAGDGYFLQAREKDDAENRTVSEQIWFSKGSNFKEEQDSVTFTVRKVRKSLFRTTVLSIIRTEAYQQ